MIYTDAENCFGHMWLNDLKSVLATAYVNIGVTECSLLLKL